MPLWLQLEPVCYRNVGAHQHRDCWVEKLFNTRGVHEKGPLFYLYSNPGFSGVTVPVLSEIKSDTCNKPKIVLLGETAVRKRRWRFGAVPDEREIEVEITNYLG